MKDLLAHLKSQHKFEFPVESCLKSQLKAVKICIKKIFEFGACLYCDSQRFQSYRAVQTHMRDSNHMRINLDDIVDYFYKYYDAKNLVQKATEEEKKTKEFKLLKKLLVSSTKNKKKKKEEEIEEVEEVEEIDENLVVEEDKEEEKEKVKEEGDDEESDYSDELKEINFVRMDNGEIMLRDGTVLGNKIYSTYYKQRVKINPDIKETKHALTLRLKAQAYNRKKNIKENSYKNFSHWKLKGSKKSNFVRINTFIKVTKTG